MGILSKNRSRHPRLTYSFGSAGHDGLSTMLGPLGGAHRPLDANETNTIQSMNALKDTYDFIGQSPPINSSFSTRHQHRTLTPLTGHYGDIGYADYFLKEVSSHPKPFQRCFTLKAWYDHPDGLRLAASTSSVTSAIIMLNQMPTVHAGVLWKRIRPSQP